MASFFESPLFWIIVVWWLLTTFLGAKARRRRAMRAQSAPEEQPPAPFGRPQPQVEREDAFRREGLAETEVRDKALEKQPAAPPPQVPPRGVRPEPPAGPAMPLDDLFRRIGLPEGLAPAVRPRWVEEAALAEEPEITPEPVPVEEPPEPPPVKPLPTGEEAYITPVIRQAHPLLPETILGRLTPLQQVVLMREILGQPRGLRGNIR